MSECRGSGRRVSESVRRKSIYVKGAWLGWCPVCYKATPWTRGEVNNNNNGYVRRFAQH